MISIQGKRLIRTRRVTLQKAMRTKLLAYSCGETDCSIEEYEAYTRGEEVNQDLLPRCDDIMIRALPIRIGEEVALLDDSGDVVLSYTKATLIRQFDLVRNYFEDYPEMKEIRLPYSSQEITDSLYPILRDDDSTVRLASCFGCVSYLMPTHSDYRLRFSLEGCTIEQLATVGRELDTRTRTEIVHESRVPMLGEGVLAVTPFVGDGKQLKEILVDYPSYLLRLLSLHDTYEDVREVILKETFEDESGIDANVGDVSRLVMTVAMDDRNTWEEFVHCLTLLDLRCDLLGNTNSPGFLPYQAVPMPGDRLLTLCEGRLTLALEHFNRPGITFKTLAISLGVVEDHTFRLTLDYRCCCGEP